MRNALTRRDWLPNGSATQQLHLLIAYGDYVLKLEARDETM
jgi:hypothetical protein